MERRDESIQEELERREEEIQLKIQSILDEEDEEIREEMIQGLDEEELEAFNEAMDELEDEEDEDFDEDDDEESLNEEYEESGKARLYEMSEYVKNLNDTFSADSVEPMEVAVFPYFAMKEYGDASAQIASAIANFYDNETVKEGEFEFFKDGTPIEGLCSTTAIAPKYSSRALHKFFIDVVRHLTMEFRKQFSNGRTSSFDYTITFKPLDGVRVDVLSASYDAEAKQLRAISFFTRNLNVISDAALLREAKYMSRQFP